MEKTRYIVVGCGRSGTTWLGDLIDQHSQASCLMEPCGTSYEARLDQHHLFWDDDDVWICPSESPPQGTYKWIGNYFKDKIWALPTPVCGAKMLAFYFNRFREVRNYLCSRGMQGLKVIWIHRNPIRVTLSSYHAEKLNSWNATDPKDIKERKPVEIPYSYFGTKMASLEREHDLLNELFHDNQMLHVHYERLLRRTDNDMSRVFGFLGLPTEQVHSRYHKMTQGEFRDLVINWKELELLSPAKWNKHWDRPIV